MTKEKSDKSDGGKFRFAQYIPQTIILGIVLAVATIGLLSPNLWKNYSIPILLIAAGLAIPFLFSPWKFWAGYGFQVGIAPGVAFVLMGVFILLFGYTTDGLWWNAVSNLFWTNIVTLLLWLVFIIFLFRYRQDSGQKVQDYYRGERWRDYRWIIAPVVLILLFLFDTSWAQSTLSIASLQKSVFKSASLGTFEIHAEYPSQILFDDTDQSEFHIWATGSFDYVNLEISGKGLLFAFKPTLDSSIEWSEKLNIQFDKNTNASTLLMQPAQPPEFGSQLIQIELSSSGQELETADWLISIESKRDSQIRDWKKNFLGTGSTIVSLVTAVFAGIKQWEEEKKRQKEEEKRREEEQIKQSLEFFYIDVMTDSSKTLEEHLKLIVDKWNTWNTTLQEQFRDKYRSLFNKSKKNDPTFWVAIVGKTLAEITSDVNLCLKICESIFDDKEEKPISTLEKLQAGLQQDGEALLSLVRDYSESITIAKRIVKSYPKEIKDDILRKLNKKYKKEINLLARELDFPTEYPLLESLFWRYRRTIQDNEKLKEWLRLHKLSQSPFADAITPFTALSKNNEGYLVDLAPTGFSFDFPSDKQIHFRFNDAWDIRTAVYGFCKAIPSTVASKAFLVLVPPFLMIDYEKETALNIVLHALGEQWLNTIADEPAAFYDLNIHQQKMLARLLCWHYGSMHSVLARLSREIDNKYPLALSENQQNQEEKNAREFLKKAPHWLEGTAPAPIQFEEIPYLLGLRPSSTQRTFLLMPSVGLDFQTTISISPEKYDVFDTIVDWLNIHNYTFIHFYLADQQWWRVEEERLIRILNERIRHCVIQEDNHENQINSLNELFAGHEKEEAEKILARKANGSPGRMVRLGQKLLLQHVQKYPPDEPLHIEDLEALEV